MIRSSTCCLVRRGTAGVSSIANSKCLPVTATCTSTTTTPTTTTKRRMTRAASGHDLSGWVMLNDRVVGGGNGSGGSIDTGNLGYYYDQHRPNVSLQRTMKPNISSHHPTTVHRTNRRMYGTTLQLTSLDEPTHSSTTWDDPVRHCAQSSSSSSSSSSLFDHHGHREYNDYTYDIVMSINTENNDNDICDDSATTNESSTDYWNLHGYVPTHCPATTEDGGDMMLDIPSAAAEVAMMMETSYYHASYRSSSSSPNN